MTTTTPAEPTSSAGCTHCGTRDVEPHTSGYAAARLGAYGPVCERCHTSVAPDSPPGTFVKRRVAKRPEPTNPDWVDFREALIRRMLRDGAFHYIAHDHVAGYCPICRRGILGVRFVGRTPAADITCTAGCDGHDILKQLGRANDPNR